MANNLLTPDQAKQALMKQARLSGQLIEKAGQVPNIAQHIPVSSNPPLTELGTQK